MDVSIIIGAAGVALVGTAIAVYEIRGKVAPETLNSKRARKKVAREFGSAVVERLSPEQITALSKYEGPSPPAPISEAEAERNRWEPQTAQEARKIVSGIVFTEQMRRLAVDPSETGRASVAPSWADGRPVSYFSRGPRGALRFPNAYWEALKRNQEQMLLIYERAEPNARPALTWEKPDHMELTENNDPAQLALGFDDNPKICRVTNYACGNESCYQNRNCIADDAQ
jgi:hypothetical protein